jgi:hypothetical protein
VRLLDRQKTFSNLSKVFVSCLRLTFARLIGKFLSARRAPSTLISCSTVNRTPTRLKTAVGSFSRAMNVILGPEVQEFTVNYIDDLLIMSDSFKQYLQHLDKVLSRLQEAKMTISLEKSSFLQEDFWGTFCRRMELPLIQKR